MAPRILIFSIAMGADYSFEVKDIEIWVPEFFKHNNSSVASVYYARAAASCSASRAYHEMVQSCEKNFVKCMHDHGELFSLKTNR